MMKVSSIKNTTKLDLMNDMQIFVCSINNRANSENIKQNFERVMSYNENLIHAGLGSLSPKEIMQMSSLSSRDLKGQLNYMQFAKDFPHPDWYDKPMSHDDACKRLAQIDNYFDKENGEVSNEKIIDTQTNPEFKDIYKQVRMLTYGQDTKIKANDPLNKAKHLARVNDSLDSISSKLNERSADQLKGVMNEKIRNDADIQNRMDVISTWNKAHDTESLSATQEMKKNFHQGLKDMVGYKNKQEKALEELYDIMENGYPPMTDKEYRDNIAEKEADVKAIENEIKQLDKDTIAEKNKLLKEMKTAEPFGEKFNQTLKALKETQTTYEGKMAEHNQALAFTNQSFAIC